MKIKLLEVTYGIYNELPGITSYVADDFRTIDDINRHRNIIWNYFDNKPEVWLAFEEQRISDTELRTRYKTKVYNAGRAKSEFDGLTNFKLVDIEVPDNFYEGSYDLLMVDLRFSDRHTERRYKVLDLKESIQVQVDAFRNEVSDEFLNDGYEIQKLSIYSNYELMFIKGNHKVLYTGYRAGLYDMSDI